MLMDILYNTIELPNTNTLISERSIIRTVYYQSIIILIKRSLPSIWNCIHIWLMLVYNVLFALFDRVNSDCMSLVWN